MSKETNFVTHLECSLTGTKYEKNKIHGLSEEGKPLLVRYDLKKMAMKMNHRHLLFFFGII